MIRITFRQTAALRRAAIFVNPDTHTLSSHVRAISFINIKKLFKISDQVKKEIFTPANLITASRIVASPIITVAIINDQKELAMLGFVYCCVSDWLDGTFMLFAK